MEFIEIFEALPVEKKLRSPISPVFYSKSPRIIGGNKSLMVKKRALKLEEYARICEKENSEPLDFEKL